MAIQTVLDEDFGVLYYDQDNGLLHHKANSNITGEQWKTLLLTGNKILKENKLQKWLSDNRSIGVLAEEDSNWINNEWLPSAIELGWKYWALILPEDQVVAMNMSEFITAFNERGIRVQVFTELEEGMEWLIEASH